MAEMMLRNLDDFAATKITRNNLKSDKIDKPAKLCQKSGFTTIYRSKDDVIHLKTSLFTGLG